MAIDLHIHSINLDGTDKVEKLVEKAIEILKDDQLKNKTKKKSLQLLKNKTDLNDFFFWLISEFPTSVNKYK